MSEDIDIRVSPALHPDTISALDGFNDDSAKFVGDAVSLFRDTYTTVSKIHNATEMGRKDPTHTEEHRILIVGKEAAKQRDRLLRRFDLAAESTRKGIEFIERELSAPIESKAATSIAAEIRAHSKSLGGRQVDFVHGLIEAGDDASVSAVLGGPAFLSGLTEDMRTALTRMWHEKQNPVLVQRLTLLKAVQDKLDRDAGKVFTELEKAVGASPSTVRSIETAHGAAQAALRIEPTA